MLESHYYKDMIEAGCDEAGRGCLAGSVYAAAVILPPDYQNPDLNDSKKLTDKKRKALREQIERDAVAWAVGIVTPEEIDQINIPGDASCLGSAEGASRGSDCGWQPFQALQGPALYHDSKRRR